MNPYVKQVGYVFWFAGVPLSLQQPCRSHEWEIKVYEYDCLQDHCFTDRSNPPELQIIRCMILCKTIYN